MQKTSLQLYIFPLHITLNQCPYSSVSVRAQQENTIPDTNRRFCQYLFIVSYDFCIPAQMKMEANQGSPCFCIVTFYQYSNIIYSRYKEKRKKKKKLHSPFKGMQFLSIQSFL